MNLNLGRGSAGSLGIDYVIQDNTKQVAANTTTTEVNSLDTLFVIHADKGIPNHTFTNMTLANFSAVFGEVNAKKHGMQAAAAYKHASLGHTVSVCRVDKGAAIANIYPKITFAAAAKKCYIYEGEIFNISEASITAGEFDGILESLDVSSTAFIAAAKKVTVPVLTGVPGTSSFENILDVDNFVIELAKIAESTTGSLGIKTRTIAPFALHASGAGAWGSKITGAFGTAITVRNSVPTRSLVVSYNGTAASTYSGIGLVPAKSDDLGIQLYLGTKLRDKEVIANYLGDLNLRMVTDETNEDMFEDAFVEYYTALIADLEAQIETNNAAILAATGGDAQLVLEMSKAVLKYKALLESIEDADITPFQMIGWDGNSIYANVGNYNLVYVNGKIVPDSFTLLNGTNGLVKGMRRFDYAYGDGTTTVADLYKSYFAFTLDARFKDIGEVKSLLTYDFDYPTAVRKQLIAAVQHGKGTRGDIIAIGGMPSTIKTYDSALEYAKALKLAGGKYFLLTEHCEVFDSVQNKNITVSAVYALMDAISTWYNDGRKFPVSDYTLSTIIKGTIVPRITDTDEQSTLYNYDANLLKLVDNSYRLRSQSVGDVGFTSKLKELHNAINFADLIKVTHNAVDKYSKGNDDDTNLSTIQEKISKEIEDFKAYFQGAPTVTLSFLDEDAEARGEADLELTVNMYGTIKVYHIKFIVNSATSS